MEEEKKEKKGEKKGEGEKKKPFWLYDFISHLQSPGGRVDGRLDVGGGGGGGEVVVVVGAGYSFIPLSLHLPSVCLRSPSLPTPASFCSIYSYSTVNHFYEEGEKKWVSEAERERGRERNPEIADGSGIFFFMFLSFRIWTGDVEKR